MSVLRINSGTTNKVFHESGNPPTTSTPFSNPPKNPYPPHPNLSTNNKTLHLIPIFSEIRLSSGENPHLDIPPPGDYTSKTFFVLLTSTKQADLTTRFKRAADTVFLEAKNSTISSISQIPPWFYVLLLVLGWNELMAVLRNPILIVLFVVMAGGGWIVVQAGMVGPIVKIGNAVVEQSLEIARVRILLLLTVVLMDRIL